MGKREFLEVLGGRLAEELPRSMVISQLQYYEDYIDGELAKGRKLADVMEELGDPVMIAHTIINTETGESFQGYAEDAEYVEIPQEESVQEEPYQQRAAFKEKEVEYTHLHTENEEERQAREYEQQAAVQKRKFNVGCLVVGIAIVAVLLVVLSLVGSLVSALLPILLPVIVIFMVFSFVFGRRR